jgi:dTDP-4-amino-4,6-dideoxygalactose transaminase
MNVPILDLKAQHAAIRDAVLQKVMPVIEAQAFILGQPVLDLEARIAALSHAAHGIGVASGTDGLLLPLKALDLKPGDEVITTPFTFFATGGAIHNAGGTPVFVDIDPVTYNIDPAAVAAAVTRRTRAILPVHLYGQMAAMEALLPIAQAHGLAVIEDACQSIGARRKVDGQWRTAGELGTATSFSFFPSKNLGGWGDGGMVVTSDAAMAERVRRLRTHGGAKMYHHDEVGLNSRLDALQAAVLLAKLPYLQQWSEARRANAAWYARALAGVPGLATPVTEAANEHIFHQYVIQADRRDALQAHLKAQGIGSAIYYPLPLHLQPCFAHLGYTTGRLPVSEAACARVLALPVYPELTDPQKEHVAAAIRGFYGA